MLRTSWFRSCRVIAHLWIAGLVGAGTVWAQTQSTVVSGLKNPARLIVTPQRNLLVAEAGDFAPNTGRVSRVSQGGAILPLLDHLPSGVAPDNVTGPWSLYLLEPRTLLIAIGTGDSTVADEQGNEVPNPQGPSSPLFSSILEVRFSKPSDQLLSGFDLTLENQYEIADGRPTTLHNAQGEEAAVSVLTNIPDIIRNPITGLPQRSNPFGLAVASRGGRALYATDASRNAIHAVDLQTGRTSKLVALPPVPNPLPFGPSELEPVPTGIAEYKGSLLIALETGFPFPSGAASIQRFDLQTGQLTPFITNLTEVIDVLAARERGDDAVYVIELSTDLLNGAPGRLLKFRTPNAAPQVLSDSLIFPSSVARDPMTGALFVTEFFSGDIVKITP